MMYVDDDDEENMIDVPIVSIPISDANLIRLLDPNLHLNLQNFHHHFC